MKFLPLFLLAACTGHPWTYADSHRAIVQAWVESRDLTIAGRCLEFEVKVGRPITSSEIRRMR